MGCAWLKISQSKEARQENYFRTRVLVLALALTSVRVSSVSARTSRSTPERGQRLSLLGIPCCLYIAVMSYSFTICLF